MFLIVYVNPNRGKIALFSRYKATIILIIIVYGLFFTRRNNRFNLLFDKDLAC